jgi:hypothetical protein
MTVSSQILYLLNIHCHLTIEFSGTEPLQLGQSLK